jgi:hypothetical protein
MKKFVLSSITLASILVIGMTVSSNASGPGGNRTGSPGSSGNCSGCHGGASNYGGSLKVGITATGDTTFLSTYTPGQVYDMHVIAGGTSTRKGFQATMLTSSNASAGTCGTAPSGTSVYTSGGKSIWGHNTPSATGVWKGTWTAPAAGTGTVTMYGAAVVSNSNGSDSKDQVVTASAMIGEKAAASNKNIEASLLKVCGNPANTVVRLNAVAKNMIIWNNQGQVAASANNTSELNVSHLPAGTYYLQTVSENNIHNTTAIVIQ